jgi:hypothetical protein
MPRDSNGNYSLPAGNPVAAGEIVDADWANDTMNDIAEALNDSLSRSGDGGMQVPLLFADGTEAAPGIAWINEPSSGFYRAGLGDMRVSILGGKEFRWLDEGCYEWDDVNEEWVRLIASNDITVNEDGSITFESPVTFNDEVTFNDTVTFNGDTYLDGATYLDGELIGSPVPSDSTHRYWRISYGGSVSPNGQISDGSIWTGGAGFKFGKRWSKGAILDIEDATITSYVANGGFNPPSANQWKQFYQGDIEFLTLVL